MNHKVIIPPPHLSDYTRFFWFLETDTIMDKPFVHHAFAYSCPEIIFCYKGLYKYKFQFDTEKNLSSAIYGQTQSFSKVSVEAGFGVFGIYLYPHALPQLFGLPASEITNQSIDIKAFCGKEGEILEEKIMLASNNDQRVKIFCDFLEDRLKNTKTGYKGIISSIKSISTSFRPSLVKALADSNFLSVRQFERRFKEFSGFSPKLFLRITRFNSVLKKSFHGKSLAEVAYEYGYYDQSHFIHDFQKFSGCNPKEYFKPGTIAATDRGTVEFME